MSTSGRGALDDRIRYSGLDLSERLLHLSRRKFPKLTYYDAGV